MATLLDVDRHAVFVVDSAQAVHHVNGRSVELIKAREIVQASRQRLVGRTNQVTVQRVQALQAVIGGRRGTPRTVRAAGKERFTFELFRLDLEPERLVLLRVYENFAESARLIRSRPGDLRRGYTDAGRPTAGPGPCKGATVSPCPPCPRCRISKPSPGWGP